MRKGVDTCDGYSDKFAFKTFFKADQCTDADNIITNIINISDVFSWGCGNIFLRK